MKNIYKPTNSICLILLSLISLNVFAANTPKPRKRMTFHIECSLGSQFGSVPHQLKRYLYTEDYSYTERVTDYFLFFPIGTRLITHYVSSKHHEYQVENRNTYIQSIDIRQFLNFRHGRKLSVNIHAGIGISAGNITRNQLQVFQSDLAFDTPWWGLKMGLGVSSGFVYLNKDYYREDLNGHPDRYSAAGSQKFFVTPELRFGPLDYAFVKWSSMEDCPPLYPLDRICIGSGFGDYTQRGLSAGLSFSNSSRNHKASYGFNIAAFYRLKNNLKLSINFDRIGKMTGYDGIDNTPMTKTEDYPTSSVYHTFWMTGIKASYQF